RDVVDGLRYIGTQQVLLLSFAIDIAAMVLALPRALFPEVAQERFGPASIGWLYSAISLGSVLAGLTSGWIGRVRRQGLALVAAVGRWGRAGTMAAQTGPTVAWAAGGLAAAVVAVLLAVAFPALVRYTAGHPSGAAAGQSGAAG